MVSTGRRLCAIRQPMRGARRSTRRRRPMHSFCDDLGGFVRVCVVRTRRAGRGAKPEPQRNRSMAVVPGRKTYVDYSVRPNATRANLRFRRPSDHSIGGTYQTANGITRTLTSAGALIPDKRNRLFAKIDRHPRLDPDFSGSLFHICPTSPTFPGSATGHRHSPRAWLIRSGFPPDAPGEDRTLGHTRIRGVECALGPGVVCLGARQRRHQSRFQIWDVDRLELLGRGQ